MQRRRPPPVNPELHRCSPRARLALRMPSSPEETICSREPRKGGRMRFHDKVALITAAASGIGRATADIMAKDGAVIVAVDNNRERLDRAVAELAAAGGRAHGKLCDALDRAQVDALVAAVAREFG